MPVVGARRLSGRLALAWFFARGPIFFGKERRDESLSKPEYSWQLTVVAAGDHVHNNYKYPLKRLPALSQAGF